MPIVRNVSKHNVIINEKTLIYGKSTKVSEDQLESLQNLIDEGILNLEPQTVNRVENFETSEAVNIEFQLIKNRIVPALFSLHLNQDLTEEELLDLKWFFKNVGPTSQLDNNLKSLLDDVKHTEEFIEVLLNHLYPQLIKNSVNKKHLSQY